MLNRCCNTGLGLKDPFLDIVASNHLRKTMDTFIDGLIDEWFATVPFANHFEGTSIHKEYYVRNLIETIWRIRLLRVSESKALAEIAKISPVAAQGWANYEKEEMTHDELFAHDLSAQGVTRNEILATEPYLSTKLLTGFMSYLLDHEGPLGVVAYSYLVEYVNVKLEPKKLDALKKSMGEKNIRGQISHSNTDLNDDHPGEVWQVIRHLIRGKDDIESLYRYLREMQTLLAMYFKELYEDKVQGKLSEVA
ncbi:MAG: hypothetical protein SFW66_08640 [Gammaproteobacteria bacterium]|nr:hypothetical protein [Gammaproteobacteria bacterium]